MARPLRLEVPDGIHHVMARGWERRPLFSVDDDRELFLQVLRRTLRRCDLRCLSYCLMDNHYHLVLRTPQANLSRGMCLLNGGFATFFNRRYGREGSLFARRFKGILLQQDAHLLEVLRYVALNPVRAGLCRHPSEWPWSAHRAIAGQEDAGIVAAAEARSFFEGHGSYANFVAGAPDMPIRSSGVVDGDVDFVREALRSVDPDPEIPRAHWGAGRPALDDILRGHDRDEAIARAYRGHGYSMGAIAAALGCHVSTVSRRLRRYEAGEG